jgi:hypothetical protein
MKMGLTATDTGGGNNYPPCPTGLHHAVCYAVYDLGTQHNDMFNTDQHKCIIVWELPNERIDVEIDGVKTSMPRAISDQYTVSLSEKSKLRPILESWRGRGFTNQELIGFDIFSVLKANCMLNIIHKPKQNGDTKAVISSVTPIPKGIQQIQKTELLIFLLKMAEKYQIRLLSGLRN